MTETARRLDLAARREREERQREQLGDARHFYVDQLHSPVERCVRCHQPREAEVHKVGNEDYQ